MNCEPEMLKKDICWQIKDSVYVIRNVPYFRADYDGEELLDLEVSLKLTTLRDLMDENAIPFDVDFMDFADIHF